MSLDVNFVVSTVLAAHQVGATPQQRTAEVQLFDQLKNGQIASSAAAGAELTQPTRPLEAQLLGYAVLQHLVGNRWEDFTGDARSQCTSLAYSLVQQSAQGARDSGSGNTGGWVVRSKAALLLALVMKRSGPDFLDTSLQQLLGQSSAGPAMQEAVCLVLHYLTDEVVQFTDDMNGEQIRHMVARLTSALPAVLQFVEHTLETNFAALQTAGLPREVTASHTAAVHAALGAAQAFAEWAPVALLKASGLVVASGFLLGSAEFREAGCQVLLLVAGRKRTTEEDESGFVGAMQEAVSALMRAAESLLAPASIKELDYEGENDEFGQAVCEAMATLGSLHISTAFPNDSTRLSFLHIMLAFAQHAYLPLADKALALWAKLLQDAATHKASSIAASAAGNAPTEGTGTAASPSPSPLPSQQQQQHHVVYSTPLPPEAVVALMQLAAEQLQQRNPHTPQHEDDIPPYFDSFEDYKEFMIGYRLKLSNIVKAAAAVLPQQALHAASERLTAAVAAAAGAASANGGAPGPDQARVMLGSAVIVLESTLKAVWDAVSEPNDRAAVVAASEPMFQSLLALHVSDPQLLQSQARGLEGFSRLIETRPEMVPSIVSRLFDLLIGCVPLEAGGHVAPPSKPAAGWREGFQARGGIAIVFLEFAKMAPAAFLPHLDAIAQRLTELIDANQLRPGEQNSIKEALLAASTAGSDDLQANLAEWALGPVRTEWTTAEFQARIASPEAFMARYLPTPPPAEDASGPQVPNAALRWALYHQVHLVERCIRRMQHGGTAEFHPLAAHMAWAVPSLLRLVACLNAVYSPAGRVALGGAAAALDMSPQEKALYLRRGGPGARRAAVTASGDDADQAGDYSSTGGTTTSSVRVWMRHLREFAFHALGMLPTHVGPSLDLPGLAQAFNPSALAYMDSLGHQHIRIILRHVSIPYLRNVKARHLESWVLPGLALLMPHMQHRLAAAWAGLTPSSGPSTEGSVAADNEIIEERMVRELTQEYADLLREVSTRTIEDPGPLPGTSIAAGVGGGVKSGGPQVRTLLEMLLEREPAAGIAAATAAVDGMQRADDAAFRFAMFCKALVTLAPRDPRLYSYAGSEVLRAAVGSLASETMASHHAEILGLIRTILVQQLGDAGSAVHGVLQSLPGVTPERENTFATALLGMNSEKEQRNAVKTFLVEACGRGSFAALADWRPPTVVVFGAALKQRGTRIAAPKDDGSEDQLQGDITRALLS